MSNTGLLLTTLASQAGIALENAILYAEIQHMLEGFVRASVEAILLALGRPSVRRLPPGIRTKL